MGLNGTFYVTKVAASNGECEQHNDPRRCWVKVLKEPNWVGKIQMPRHRWVLIEGGNLEPTDSFT